MPSNIVKYLLFCRVVFFTKYIRRSRSVKGRPSLGEKVVKGGLVIEYLIWRREARETCNMISVRFGTHTVTHWKPYR